MNNFRMHCTQCVGGVIGGSMSGLFMELLYGLLVYGKDHPVNIAFKLI